MLEETWIAVELQGVERDAVVQDEDQLTGRAPGGGDGHVRVLARSGGRGGAGPGEAGNPCAVGVEREAPGPGPPSATRPPVAPWIPPTTPAVPRAPEARAGRPPLRTWPEWALRRRWRPSRGGPRRCAAADRTASTRGRSAPVRRGWARRRSRRGRQSTVRRSVAAERETRVSWPPGIPITAYRQSNSDFHRHRRGRRLHGRRPRRGAVASRRLLGRALRRSGGWRSRGRR